MITGFGEREDETPCATLNYRVELDPADKFGSQVRVLRHLDRMWDEMPHADALVLRFECSRRPS